MWPVHVILQKKNFYQFYKKVGFQTPVKYIFIFEQETLVIDLICHFSAPQSLSLVKLVLEGQASRETSNPETFVLLENN